MTRPLDIPDRGKRDSGRSCASQVLKFCAAVALISKPLKQRDAITSEFAARFCVAICCMVVVPLSKCRDAPPKDENHGWSRAF